MKETRHKGVEPAVTTESVLDMVIFGGTGDLAIRKLLPALYTAFAHGNLPADTRILALGRQVWKREAYHAFLEEKSKPFISSTHWDEQTWTAFLACCDYVKVDAQCADDFAVLSKVLRPKSLRVFYLSTAPSLFTEIGENLALHHAILPNTRVVLEKPLGSDLESSQKINDAVGKRFAEHQIYRIDHYLGKETVQNLMILRFGNSIFEPLWRSEFIKSVQITVAETVGVGSRAGFYDSTGAMRDMVQNHLLQLLCIVAMEPPVSLEADAVRDEKRKVLKSLRPMGLAEVERDTVRGQYAAGVVAGAPACAYAAEENIPKGSATETFVALKCHINNWRWANVPFFLRTGKRLQKHVSEIVIEFSALPFSIFGAGNSGQSNRLRIQLQPQESLILELMAKEPGSGMYLRPVDLKLDLQSAFSSRRAEAYERLLVDVVRGRLTHFMRHDELEAAWEWVDPIIQAWKTLDTKPRQYAAGTWGPPASSALIAKEGNVWIEEAE